MEGKTKTFSRTAGIINIAAALFLVVVLVFFLTIGNLGILNPNSSSNGEESEGETTEEQQKEAAGKALGFVISLIFFLPIILILLIPLGIVDVIQGLVIGSRCFKAAPGTGAVIFSLILKILTVPVFGFAALLLAALSDVADSSAPALFPALIAFYVAALIVAHVFEWLANRSARRA